MLSRIIKLNLKNPHILIISDTHFPNCHPDTFKFLTEIKKTLKPSLVVQIGDLVELGTVSRYTLDPNYISPSDEFEKAFKYVQRLIKLFPNLYWVLGNHDIRALAKGERDGIPSNFFKDFDILFDLPKSWHVCQSLILNNEILFTHGKSAVPNKVAEYTGYNVVQGHFHNSFAITWLGSSKGDLFSLYTGCLIDDESIVFNYNKMDLKRPILGCGFIKNKLPYLIKMPLNNKGRLKKGVKCL